MKMKMIDLKGQGKNNGRRVKAWQVILGVLALVLVPSLGNTFAGAISVNAGQNVEFGQGIATAAACDPAVTITPESTLDLATATYKLERITISDLELRDSSTAPSNLTCRGKTLKLQIVNSAPAVQNWIPGGVSTGLAAINAGGTSASTTVSGLTVTLSNANSETGTVLFVVDTPTLLASDVAKILIQTK